MSIETLREWLIHQPSFNEKVDAVIRHGILNEYPAITPSGELPEHDWPYLLLCASTLARSDDAEEQRIALRIADTCLLLGTTNQEEKAAAAVIIDTMANKRSVMLAAKRSLIPEDLEKALPLPLRADYLKRSAEDLIQTSDCVQHPVNRFQKAFWEAMSDGQWVSASAPTSAGKSFLLRLWVAEVFRRSPKAHVVFIVPTRALIQEFYDSFNIDMVQGELKNVILHMLPLEDASSQSSGHLYIYTQERLHILLSRKSDIAFDLLVIDEGQKVGDSYRGVLLEQVISECVRRSPDTQIVYASPFVDNPAYLIRGAPTDIVTKPVKHEVTTVTQNLLFLSQKWGDPETWLVDYVDDVKVLQIGKIKLPFRATSEGKRLSTVALAMRNPRGGNLIYVNGPAAAEHTAYQLSQGFQSLQFPALTGNTRITDLIKLIQKTIHQKYLLIETLKYGIAYHYGNMPLLIRKEIEALFRDNIIKFLVCTATLIEGVNLPCNAIFMRGPTKGNGKPMLPPDFWNLAGRAGRWGTEFHGTIVCVDARKATVWKNPPPTSRVQQTIKATSEIALETATDLIKYIDNGYIDDAGHGEVDYDYTLTFLIHSMMKNMNVADLPSSNALTADQQNHLQDLLANEIQAFSLPHELVFRHPGILPHSMNQLLQELRSLTPTELATISPVLPESDDAVDHYETIFKFINTHLRANWASPGPFGDKRIKQLAILTVDWMKGRPLAVLIKARERINSGRVSRGQTGKSLSSIIISVMKDVEEYARFKIPKYLRAFLDVLYFHTQETGVTDGINVLPNIELWLEMGVSVRTQLSLMELGLSRTSAIEIFDLMMDHNMSKDATLEWLKQVDLAMLNVPELVKQEIVRVLERHQIV